MMTEGLSNALPSFYSSNSLTGYGISAEDNDVLHELIHAFRNNQNSFLLQNPFGENSRIEEKFATQLSGPMPAYGFKTYPNSEENFKSLSTFLKGNEVPEELINPLKGVLDKMYTNFEEFNTNIVDTSLNIKNLETSSSSLSNSFLSSANSLISGIGSLFGAEGQQVANLAGQVLQFGTMAAKSYGYAEGGIINEPVFGVGLKSGSNYTFGEKESELVTPMSKMNNFGNGGETTNVNMSLSINAVDTQTGMEFLMKNSDFLQAQMVKAIKNNKSIRSSVKRS